MGRDSTQIHHTSYVTVDGGCQHVLERQLKHSSSTLPAAAALRRRGGGGEAITPSHLKGLAGAATASSSPCIRNWTIATYGVLAWASGRPSRVVVSSAAGLIITVTDGEGEVTERGTG